MGNYNNAKEEFLTYLINIEPKLERIVTEAVPPHLVFEGFVKDGKNMVRCLCKNCGSQMDVEKPDSSSYMIRPGLSCPECGTNMAYCAGRSSIDGSGMWHKPKTLFQKAETGFALIHYDAHIYYADDGKVPFAWMSEDPDVDVSIRDAFCYIENAGFFKAEHFFGEMDDISAVRPANAWRYYKQYCVSDEEREIADKMFEDARERCELSKKSIHKGIDPESVYVPSALNDMRISGIKRILHQTKEQAGSECTISCLCLNCKTTFDVKTDDGPYGVPLQCPECGTRDTAVNAKKSLTTETVAYFENTKLPNHDLLIRFVDVIYEVGLSGGKLGYTSKLKEKVRFYVGTKKSGKPFYRIYVAGNNGFVKGTVRDLDRYWRWSQAPIPQITQSDDELRNIIERTSMRHSGLIEAYGLGNPAYRPYCEKGDIEYIMMYVKAPQVEKLLKANLTSCLHSITWDISALCAGNTPAEILAVKHAAIKMGAEHDLVFQNIRDVNLLMQYESNLDWETYQEMYVNHIPTLRIRNLKAEYGISYREALRYLHSARDHQCIDMQDACNIWLDYLNMARLCHIDLSDKSRKYPSSLKKEHDIATYAVNKLKTEIDKERFAVQAAHNAKELNYAKDGLVAIVPETPEDVIEEASAQKNCLRSYLDRIKTGDSKVVFIRRKDDPKQSYVTVEVNSSNEIVQVKGKCNSNPMNTELREFMNKWCAEKGLAFA